MARFVTIASVLFTLEHLRGTPPARQAILRDLEQLPQLLAGRAVDLVVLSEGVSQLAQTVEQAERLENPGPVLTAYQDLGRSLQCTVAGSVKLTDGRRIFNSIAYIGPDGRPLGAYHKTFLTLDEIESGLSPGEGASVVETPAGRLGGVICFDLNFPELRREYAALRPDILTFASMYHGGAVVQGIWAYDCQAYFVAALPFHGGGVLDPFGRPLALTDCYNAIAIATVNLDRAMIHLDYNSTKLDHVRRQYGRRIRVEIPANIGSVLLTSVDENLRVRDVVEEFELELLENYLARSRAANGRAGG